MSTEPPPPPPPKEDVVFVHSAAPGGEGLRVIRKREDTLEIGEIRAAKEGQPLHGDLVRLKPRAESDRLFDVEVLVSREETQRALPAHAAPAHPGPAQVATNAYRDGWEAIFGRSEDPELPN
jgi:hypothetical protein